MNLISKLDWLARLALVEAALIIVAITWLSTGLYSYAQSRYSQDQYSQQQQQQQQQNRDLEYHQRQIDINSEDIKGLEHRMSNIEDMQLERRITQVETKLDTMLQILVGLCIAMGISLIEMFARIVKRKTFSSISGG